MSREGGERKKESEKEKNSAFQTQRKPQLRASQLQTTLTSAELY